MQRLLLTAAWILVLAPLSWGVARSVQRSMPLFSAGSSVPGKPTAPASSGSGPDIPTNRSGTLPPARS